MEKRNIPGEGVTMSLDKAILDLLPPDGTPVLNRVMRVMLSRQLERSIEAEEFFAARDRLFENGAVGRSRGQGGQIFLIQKTPAVPSPPVMEEWSEARLMEPLRRFLEGPFRKSLDLPEGGTSIVQNTSQMGPIRGRWTRPDFIIVSAMRFRLMPGAQVDVHSFELKTETGASVLSVHEALAQTRFTHFGHLVWHLPAGSKSMATLPEIEEQCNEHGIGLILMSDPNDIDGCEILLDPVRKATLPLSVDGFLEVRLTPEQRQTIKTGVHGSAQ
jgi:hypothetical protein